MSDELRIYTVDTGDIIIEGYISNLILKECLSFTRSITGVKNSGFSRDILEDTTKIFMKEVWHIDECVAFCDTLVQVLRVYFKLSNDNTKVILELY